MTPVTPRAEPIKWVAAPRQSPVPVTRLASTLQENTLSRTMRYDSIFEDFKVRQVCLSCTKGSHDRFKTAAAIPAKDGIGTN
jgi:hypothetical protein